VYLGFHPFALGEDLIDAVVRLLKDTLGFSLDPFRGFGCGLVYFVAAAARFGGGLAGGDFGLAGALGGIVEEVH
jgi:hypothetical protein